MCTKALSPCLLPQQRAMYIGAFLAVWRRLSEKPNESLLDFARFASLEWDSLRAVAFREDINLGVHVAPCQPLPHNAAGSLTVARFGGNLRQVEA